MFGEAVQVINKLPALRFLFFLLLHGHHSRRPSDPRWHVWNLVC
jgi:hypothetical protein